MPFCLKCGEEISESQAREFNETCPACVRLSHRSLHMMKHGSNNFMGNKPMVIIMVIVMAFIMMIFLMIILFS